MEAVTAALRAIKLEYLSSFARREVDVQFRQGVCSITFDDVPASAFDNGVPVLEQHEVFGTFYISGSFAENENFISLDRISQLARDGHDVACHTYSHYE